LEIAGANFFLKMRCPSYPKPPNTAGRLLIYYLLGSGVHNGGHLQAGAVYKGNIRKIPLLSNFFGKVRFCVKQTKISTLKYEKVQAKILSAGL